MLNSTNGGAEQADKNLRIFVIAAETSGDLIGSRIVSAIKSLCAQSNISVEFSGIGGGKMIESGVDCKTNISAISVMGFTDVVLKIPKILKILNNTAKQAVNFQPHVVLTIDASSFCFRFVKKLRTSCKLSEKTKFVHCVAPMVWAYGANRIKKVKLLFDKLLCVLPFEEEIFKKDGVNCKFIGHPILENVAENNNLKNDLDMKYALDYSVKTVFCTLGSRAQEVTSMAPIFLESIKYLKSTLKNVNVVTPVLPHLAEAVDRLFVAPLLKENIRCICLTSDEDKFKALKISSVALCKSGSNILEVVLSGVPCVVAYKTSVINYYIIKNRLNVKYASLPNIIFQKPIIPEFIQNACDPQDIACAALRLLQQTTDDTSDADLGTDNAILRAEGSQSGLAQRLKAALSNPNNIAPSALAAQEVLATLL